LFGGLSPPKPPRGDGIAHKPFIEVYLTSHVVLCYVKEACISVA